MACVVDLDWAAPLLPVDGVADGTEDGDVDPTEVLGVGVPKAASASLRSNAEDVGLAGVDPVGVADGVLDGCVVLCCCRVAWPTGLLSGGLPTASWNTTMPAMTTMKNPAAMPP